MKENNRKILTYDIPARFLWLYVGRGVVKKLATSRGLSVGRYRQRVKEEFISILYRTPTIGDLLMRTNLKWGCLQIAITNIFKDMTEEEIDMSCEYIMRHLFALRRGKKPSSFFTEKKRQSTVNRPPIDEYGWATLVDTTNFPRECSITFTTCGLCKLAKQENRRDILPHMCRLDYLMFGLTNAQLIRTKTLANGDEYCNFRFVNKDLISIEKLMEEEGITWQDLI